MLIFPAAIDDAPVILKLQRSAYLSEAELHEDFTIPPLTQTLQELELEFSSQYFIKAVEGDLIVGTGRAKLIEGTCFIGRLAVEPRMQGQGIGAQLLLALEQHFNGVDRYELFTGEKSLKNLAMYKNRGYFEFKTAQMGKTKLVFLEKWLAAK